MHPITSQEIPDTILFFDLSANRQVPDIIKVNKLSKSISLGSLMALSIEPAEVIAQDLSSAQIHKQLDLLNQKVADNHRDLYFVLMTGLFYMRSNKMDEAMQSFEYLAEILKIQNRKFLKHPDNQIVCALTSYFLHRYKASEAPLMEVWHSIKPTLMVKIEMPSDSHYYINHLVFKCGTTRTQMLETEFNCFMLPPDFLLSQIQGNFLKLQVLLDKYSDYQYSSDPLEIEFSVEYGFIENNTFLDDFRIKLI